MVRFLDEEQLEFLAHPGIPDGQAAQTTIQHNAAFYSDVLSEVPYTEHYQPALINDHVQEMQYYEQLYIDESADNGMNSDSNIIPYSQYMLESQAADKKIFDIQLRESLLTHDRLLDQIMSQDIVNIVTTSCVVRKYVDMRNCLSEKCSKCLELEAEPFKQNDMIEKYIYDKLVNDYSTLEKHCIYIESSHQITQQNFQNTCVNQDAPTYPEFCEINNLKALLQAKITTISKLKAHIKALKGSEDKEEIKKDIYKIETQNIEMEHKVARTAKLRNDILMFQQHHGESLFEAWTRFKDLLQKVPHHGIDLWLKVQIFYDHVDCTTQESINYAASGRLRKIRPDEAWDTIERLAQYENKGWNNAFTSEEVSFNYENPDVKKLLGIMERKVDTLMKNAISLMGKSETVFRLTSNERYVPLHKGVTFRLGGVEREMTLLEFGWRVGLYSEKESGDPTSGLRNAETVNATYFTHLFWPTIGDDGYNVGNTKEKSIRNLRIRLAHRYSHWG
ncbi:hypothetical protein Tco_0523172 [Tanacetum coccineum]